MPFKLGYLIPGVWSRYHDSPVRDKDAELFSQLQRITECRFDPLHWDVQEEYRGHATKYMNDGHDKYQCICSCYELERLFLAVHTPTGLVFTVGSKCMTKFGNEELNKKLESIKRNNKCPGGKLIADRRTKNGRLDQCDDPTCVCKTLCQHCKQIKCVCTRKCVKCKISIENVHETWKTMCLPCYRTGTTTSGRRRSTSHRWHSTANRVTIGHVSRVGRRSVGWRVSVHGVSSAIQNT